MCIRDSLHTHRRRRAQRGRPDRAVLPRWRRRHLHDQVRRVRHLEEHHCAVTVDGAGVDPSAPARGARLLLGLAAVAVAFAAADTYVVVLALPDMMSSVGLAIDELQRAAPIVSGFLLGYVAMPVSYTHLTLPT